MLTCTHVISGIRPCSVRALSLSLTAYELCKLPRYIYRNYNFLNACVSDNKSRFWFIHCRWLLSRAKSVIKSMLRASKVYVYKRTTLCLNGPCVDAYNFKPQSELPAHEFSSATPAQLSIAQRTALGTWRAARSEARRYSLWFFVSSCF